MSIPQRLYNEIMMSDDFTCVYCGLRTPDVVVDHVIPRSVGGPDVLHNLVAACAPCNMRKFDHQLHEVRMSLRFGRFNVKPLSIRPKERKVIDQEEKLARIRSLAAERNAEGWYKYSANAICKAVGGASAAIKAEVSAIRNGQPANTRIKQAS